MNNVDEIIMSLTEIADQPTEDGMVDGVNQQTIRDALELINYQHEHIEAFLKDQEPRLMTRKEVVELDEGKSVWFEERDDSGNTFIGPMVCHGKGLFSNRYMGVDANYLYWFGRRFWNAKPTDEQRRATKWDEADSKPQKGE